MRFHRKLQREAVSEWRPKYVQYKMLKSILARLPAWPLEGYDSRTGLYYLHSRDGAELDEVEQLFLSRLELEVVKVNEFFLAREKEALRRKEEIVKQLKMLPAVATVGPGRESILRTIVREGHRRLGSSHSISPSASHSGDFLPNAAFTQLARKRIKKALLEFYRSLELLKSFRTLNYLALGKIVKKYDKMTHRCTVAAYMEDVRRKPFYASTTPDTLLNDVENIYRRVFTGGDRSKAVRKLRLPEVQHKSYQGWATASGILGGLMLAFTANIVTIVLSGSPQIHTMALIYGGLGMPLLLAFLLSVNMLIWDSVHINYRFIFEMEQRTVLHNSQVNLLVGSFSLVYLVFVSLSLSGSFDRHCLLLHQPWVLLGCLAAMLLLPLPIFFWTSRLWLVKVLLRIGTAPLYPVHFKDFFLNDQLMSLTFSLQTLGWLIHLTAARAAELPDPSRATIPVLWYVVVLCALPAFGRMLQSFRRFADNRWCFFPHMANLIKYAMGFVVPFFGLAIPLVPWLFWVRVVFQAAASAYALVWDVWMDFGLLQGEKISYLLRETLLFPHPAIYYAAAVIDGACRFLWVLPVFGMVPPTLLTLYILAGTEVLRRFMWNLFRVEYEQVNNCNTLRAFSDIPLPYNAQDLFYQDMVEVEIAAQRQEEDTAGTKAQGQVLQAPLDAKDEDAECDTRYFHDLRDAECSSDDGHSNFEDHDASLGQLDIV